MKLSISYRVIKLALATQAKKLTVALGKFVLTKFNSEFLSLTDSVSKDYAKGLLESPKVKEETEFSFTKGNIEDIATIYDGGSAAPYFAEDYVSGDYISLTNLGLFAWTLTRALPVENLVLQDQVTFQYNRDFTDFIYATDFVDGEIDKTDKTIEFFKSTDNIPSVSDVFDREVSYVRSFSDLTSITDNSAISLTKNHTESLSSTDVHILEFNKLVLDFTGITDTAIKNLGKSYSDSFLSTDAAIKSVDKFLVESFGVTDTFSYVISLDITFSDSFVVTDSRSFLFSKGASDGASVADTFSYLLTLGVPLVDSSSVADTGFLLAQGYTVDMTYFTEDFVGESRTFT